MTVGRAAVWAMLGGAPWALLLVGLAWITAISLPHGPTLLVDLTPGWLLLLVVVRTVVRRRGRAARLIGDTAVAALCALLWPLDGAAVMPSVLAFAAIDVVGPSSVDRPLDPRIEAGLGIATLSVGALLTIALVGMPMSSYTASSIGPDGVVTETSGTLTFPFALALVVLLAPAFAVAAGAWIDYRAPFSGRWLIFGIAIGSAVLAVLAGFSIGGLLVPVGLLASLTYAVAATQPDPVDPSLRRWQPQDPRPRS